MSPTMAMTLPTVMYTPTFNAMDRHDYGIKKHRKHPSTGGGRAWSEDEVRALVVVYIWKPDRSGQGELHGFAFREFVLTKCSTTQESYLLQTRLQKMPYKHIAAHLKKTELACRLHYHQLSQGGNRRRRTTSISSSSSFSSLSNGHSPIMATNIPSPVHEHSPSRSLSPPGSVGGYGHPVSSGGVQLPSLMDAGMSSNTSSRLPAILPKPANMTLAPNPAQYDNPQNHAQPSAKLLPPATFTPAAHARNHGPSMPPLRLDCSALSPPPSAGNTQPVDMARLHAVYTAHHGTFWSAIAADYGNGAHPAVLEQAWRTGSPATVSPLGGHNSYAAHTPISPRGSHGESDGCGSRYHDKTRISAILGIDASPRSPKERELVRRMEESRVMIGVDVGA